MEAIREYLVAYTLSNLVFGFSIYLAMKKPIRARFFLAAFFLWAAFINFSTAVKSPEIYLEYGRFAFLPIYSEFIYGYFSLNIPMFIIPIALGQFLIFLGLILHGIWVQTACIGGILFGLAIAPLGVGSAFPATVLMSLAFYFLWKIENHDFIWHLKQYSYQQPQVGNSLI